MRSLRLIILFLSISSTAHTATYVNHSPLGHLESGISMYAGVPMVAHSDVTQKSIVGGGGIELWGGYSWDSGWSLWGVFGNGWWSSKESLGAALGDNQASILEFYSGLAVRYTFSQETWSPYIQATLVAEMLRVRGDSVSGESWGAGLGGQVGIRWREVPWTVWLGFDARRSQMSAIISDREGPGISRFSLVLGAFTDLGLR